MRSRRKRQNRAAQKEQEENKRILAEHVEFILGVAERARRRTIEEIIAANRRPRARRKKVGCIFGRRRSISAVPDWR